MMLIVGLLLIWACALLLRGLAVEVLWNWFVPHIFSAAPHLTYAPALAITVLAAMLIPSGSVFHITYTWTTNNGRERTFDYGSIVEALCLLFIGGVIHDLMH